MRQALKCCSLTATMAGCLQDIQTWRGPSEGAPHNGHEWSSPSVPSNSGQLTNLPAVTRAENSLQITTQVLRKDPE